MKNKDMLFDENLLIETFIKADDVCKIIEKELFCKMLEEKTQIERYRKPQCEMTESEMMTLPNMNSAISLGIVSQTV